MEATDVDTPGNVFSINLRISLTIDAGTVFLCALRCSVLLLCVWLSCRNNTTTLDNNTTTSDRHCLTVFVKTSVLGHQINRSNEPLYLNDKQYSLHNTSPQISFSSSNSAKHGVQHERYIDATAAGDGIQSNQTNGKHERVNSSSDVEHVKEKQTYTYTCIYDRKLNYDDDYGIENTTTFDDCQKGEENQSYIRSEEFKPNGTDRRTSDERADVSFSSTDSGIFIHNIREENKSTVLARDCTRFDKVKASDKSLDSAESGIFLSINTRDGHSDSSEYERRGQTNSSKDFRNPSQDQRICQLDNESISISQTIAERNVEHKYEFNDTLMSCTTECDQNHKDDGITEEDGFEETIPKSLYKVEQPRKTLSVYRKSEDVFHYVSKDSEDGFVGLMLGSMENVDQPAVPTRWGTRPDLANTLDRLQKERPMDTNRIDIPSENRNINIDSPTHVGLHHGLKTYDEHNQKPKDMSFWPFNSDCKYNEDGIFSRECSLIVNQSLLTLDSNGNNLPRQTLSSHHRLNSKQLSHVLTRRRQRRMHRKAHKENIRMVLSKYEMNRFFKSFTSRSEVKRVFPYRKCSLRYNTSAERFTGLLNRRNNETIVSPFLNQNEIPRPDIFTSDDGNRERSPAGDVYEYPNGAIDAISVATVTESMQYEWGRLRSFWSFPMDSPILPITLAKYGFYYTGRRDEVVCFSCNVSHSNWRRGDSVYAVHYQMSKRCRFMNGEDVGNIPIHGPLSCLSRRAGGRDDPLVRSAEETELGSILSTPERVISLFLGQDQANQIVAPQLNQPLPEVQKDQTETNDSLPVVSNPIETRNGTECGGGSKFSLTGLQAAAPSGGASVSRAASVSPESTITMSRPSQTPSASQPACLQTHASTTSHTALGPHTATSNTATPAANRLLTGPNASPTSNQVVTAPTGNQALTDQTCNQPQSMNQQHPTTFAQRQQQRRLEQQDQREQQQPEQGQAGPAIANGAARNLNNQVVTAAKPRYPNYAVLAVRSGTFNGFPNHLDQTPLQMARAGFFYAGYGDYVRCFFCGGGLRNWEAGDDPWVEHARWFPRCTHVKQNRGQTFINLVLQRQRELTLPNEYINTTREASSIDSNANSQDQTARIQANTDRQSSASNAQIRSNTQTGTSTNTLANTQNSTASVSSPPARKTDQVVTQTAASADEMNSPAVLSVKNMGYGDRIIQTAIQHLRDTHGPVKLTALALLEIIFGFEDIPPETPDHTQTSSHNAEGPKTEAGGSSVLKRESNNAENKIEEPQAAAAAAATQHLIPRNKLRGDQPAHSYTEEELKSIQEENSQLKEQMKCKICMDNFVCISFLPCGHLCCCAECAPAMVKCPICRQIVRGSVKTYLT